MDQSIAIQSSRFAISWPFSIQSDFQTPRTSLLRKVGIIRKSLLTGLYVKTIAISKWLRCLTRISYKSSASFKVDTENEFMADIEMA